MREWDLSYGFITAVLVIAAGMRETRRLTTCLSLSESFIGYFVVMCPWSTATARAYTPNNISCRAPDSRQLNYRTGLRRYPAR